MIMSLAFSYGKPCCNKKASKNTVSCKFNHVAKGENKDTPLVLMESATQENQNSLKCIRTNESKCAKSCATKPWWKFWVKKSKRNCPCKSEDGV